MGLDIYIHEMQEKQIAYFRKNDIFLHWVNSNIREVDACQYIEIDRSDVMKLQQHLTRFQQRHQRNDKTLHEDDFEFECYQGDKDFYLKIAEMTKWCNEILANFNFDDALLLLFSASW